MKFGKILVGVLAITAVGSASGCSTAMGDVVIKGDEITEAAIQEAVAPAIVALQKDDLQVTMTQSMMMKMTSAAEGVDLTGGGSGSGTLKIDLVNGLFHLKSSVSSNATMVAGEGADKVTSKMTLNEEAYFADGHTYSKHSIKMTGVVATTDSANQCEEAAIEDAAPTFLSYLWSTLSFEGDKYYQSGSKYYVEAEGLAGEITLNADGLLTSVRASGSFVSEDDSFGVEANMNIYQTATFKYGKPSISFNTSDFTC